MKTVGQKTTMDRVGGQLGSAAFLVPEDGSD
jgi:hypothetical protein